MASIETKNDQFAILRIEMPPCPSFPKAAVHEVGIRRNAPKIATADDSRSLFLKNIPADSTEQHFRAIFTQLVGAGRFEGITFEDDNAASSHSFEPAQAVKINTMAKKRKRDELEQQEQEKEKAAIRLPEIWTRRVLRSGSAAVVLLADSKSVQLVLKAIAKANRTRKYPAWDDESVRRAVAPLGAPWIASHLRAASSVDKAAARRSVHAFFDAFNRKEKEAAELAKRLRNEPDEDGFVTVARGGSRAAPASKHEAEEAKRRMADKDAKKKSEMKDFYRFQLRARRKEEQAGLVRRFEQDRAKVNAMKEKRGKFKPET